MIENSMLVEQYLSVCRLNPLWKKKDDDLQADIRYLYLGMLAEVGEVAEIYQKNIRDNTPIDPQDVLDELGDIAFYVHMLAAKGYGDPITCKEILNGVGENVVWTLKPADIILGLTNMSLDNVYNAMLRVGSWYGFTLSDILSANVTKLKRRLANGTIKGNGSHR